MKPKMFEELLDSVREGSVHAVEDHAHAITDSSVTAFRDKRLDNQMPLHLGITIFPGVVP